MTDNRIRSKELVREKKYEHPKDKIIRRYDKYVDLLKKDRMIDFSMLQTEFYKLIQNNPKVLERIHRPIQVYSELTNIRILIGYRVKYSGNYLKSLTTSL